MTDEITCCANCVYCVHVNDSQVPNCMFTPPVAGQGLIRAQTLPEYYCSEFAPRDCEKKKSDSWLESLNILTTK